MNREDRATIISFILTGKWHEARVIYDTAALKTVFWVIPSGDDRPAVIEKKPEELAEELGIGTENLDEFFNQVGEHISNSVLAGEIAEVGIGVQRDPESEETDYFSCGFPQPI